MLVKFHINITDVSLVFLFILTAISRNVFVYNSQISHDKQVGLQVCGFKIIRVTVSFAVTVNRNRHSKKNKEKKSGSLYIILFCYHV